MLMRTCSGLAKFHDVNWTLDDHPILKRRRAQKAAAAAAKQPK